MSFCKTVSEYEYSALSDGCSVASLPLRFACALKILLQYGVRPKLLGAADICTPSFAQHDMASS